MSDDDAAEMITMTTKLLMGTPAYRFYHAGSGAARHGKGQLPREKFPLTCRRLVANFPVTFTAGKLWENGEIGPVKFGLNARRHMWPDAVPYGAARRRIRCERTFSR